ncbi:hypothetical protein RUM43_013932 [Polyplax serrata]|uniref:Regucalcin n=1 Tax=Polyplax serrata TaxID=468196 RepID=A0AAN8P516_POLSC
MITRDLRQHPLQLGVACTFQIQKKMLKYNLEQISGRMACGEGLHWDSGKKCMYFCDINNSMIFRYVPKTNALFQAKVEAPFVSLIIPIKGASNKFIVGIGHSTAIMKWDGVSEAVKKSDLEVLHTVEEDKARNRFNDGKCDPAGRVFLGTMGGLVNGIWEDKQGKFYSFGSDRKLIQHFGDVGISNGLCWSLDGKILYYVDSLRFSIDALDYNVQTGQTANRRVVFDLPKNGVEGTPDGMTIDADGNLWLALYGGYGLICVNPKTQKLVTKIPIPGKFITCVQFGGDNLDEMYVTSATIETDPQELNVSPYLGGTFKITGLGVKGCDSIPAVL